MRRFKAVLSSVILVSSFMLVSTASACSWSWDWNNGCYEDNNRMIQEGNGSNGGNTETNIVYLPPKASQYGAVAWDFKNNIWGYSVNKPTQKSANLAAINDCGLNSCKVTAKFANTCAAMAYGHTSNGGLDAVKSDVDKTVAEQKALSACNAEASNCEIILSECSLP